VSLDKLPRIACRCANAFRHAVSLQRTITARCADSNVPIQETAALLPQYRDACLRAISEDYANSVKTDLEEVLWMTHKRLKDGFDELLSDVRGKNGERVVEERKCKMAYLRFIKVSMRFYRDLLLLLNNLCGGVPELDEIKHLWKEQGKGEAHRPQCGSPSMTSKLIGIVSHGGGLITEASPSPQLQRFALRSCYNILIYLGDLSRYRHSAAVDDGKKGLAPAVGYYALATRILPRSGVAYNQLGMVENINGNELRTLYYRYRALVAEEPHPLAKDNLDLVFNKSARSANQPPRGRDPQAMLRSWYCRLIAMVNAGEDFPQHREMETEVVARLENEIKSNQAGTLLPTIVLVNIAAEYSVIDGLRGNMMSKLCLSRANCGIQRGKTTPSP